MVNYDLTVLPGLKVRFGGNHPKIAQHFGLVNDHLPRIIHLTMVFSIFFNHPAMGVPPWLSGWWFGTMEFYDFPFILGMSSSHRTNSIIFQRARAQPPTSYGTSIFCWSWLLIIRSLPCLAGGVLRSRYIGPEPEDQTDRPVQNAWSLVDKCWQ